MSEEFDFTLSDLTFREIDLQPVFSKSLEHSFDVLFVLVLVFRCDANVVNVDENEVQVDEDLIHAERSVLRFEVQKASCLTRKVRTE